MANTAAVYARIDPDLKNEVESILSTLGLTPSSVVQMLYSQIKLTKGIPFPICLPASRPVSIHDLTREQMNAELQKGVQAVSEGHVYTADEVDAVLRQEYGI